MSITVDELEALDEPGSPIPGYNRTTAQHTLNTGLIYLDADFRSRDRYRENFDAILQNQRLALVQHISKAANLFDGNVKIGVMGVVDALTTVIMDGTPAKAIYETMLRNRTVFEALVGERIRYFDEVAEELRRQAIVEETAKNAPPKPLEAPQTHHPLLGLFIVVSLLAMIGAVVYWLW